MGTPATQRLPRAQRMTLVLDTAYAQFAKHGYDGVSMTQLAARAGVTKPILYRHFKSKDGLCAACTLRLSTTMIAAVRAATLPSLSPDRQLWAGIVAQLRFIDDHRPEWHVFVREAPRRAGLAATALAHARGEVTSLLAELIAQAIRSAERPMPPQLELDAQAHALQGAVEQMANWWESHPEQPLELVALRVMNFAWLGFGGMLAGKFWAPTDSS